MPKEQIAVWAAAPLAPGSGVTFVWPFEPWEGTVVDPEGIPAETFPFEDNLPPAPISRVELDKSNERAAALCFRSKAMSAELASLPPKEFCAACSRMACAWAAAINVLEGRSGPDCVRMAAGGETAGWRRCWPSRFAQASTAAARAAANSSFLKR